MSKETHYSSTTTTVVHLGSYYKGVLAPRSLQYGCGLQSGSPYGVPNLRRPMAGGL